MSRWPVLWAWLFVMAGVGWLGAVEVSLVNESMELAFDVTAGGALSGLRNLPCDTVFLSAPGGDAAAAADRSPWLLVLRGADGALVEVTARQAGAVRHRLSGRSLELIWEGVRPEGMEGDLEVTMRVALVPTEAKSRWELSVEGEADGLLWDVHFPRLLGLQVPAAASLAVPQYLGRVIRDPVGSSTQLALEYPQPASMQWLAFWGTPSARQPVLQQGPVGAAVESGWRPDESDAAGLYLATEDSDGWHKRFVVDCRREPGRMAWWVHHLPPLDHWPSRPGRHAISYALPYPVVVTCFRGDAHDAAAIYREWALRKPWCRRGPAEVWPTQSPLPGSPEEALWVPTWFRQVAFWAKFYHEPAKVVPEWAAYRRWLRVPMASHYYRYTIARFDDDYPEPLPADPYLLQGMVAAREMGVRPLPYINGVIWDTGSQSWLREGAQAAAIKDEAGAWIPWDIHGEIFAYMCPVESWRAKLREVTRKLVGEHAMAGVYLDCLAATRAMPCYDPLHQHSLRGGDYRSKNNRRLLEELRLGTRRLVPDAAFFTEEIGEQYLDLMDGFLTLDLTRSSLRPGEQVWPLFSAVYHPYALNFGSDARLDMPAEAFAWQMGTLFTWGMVPLLSTGVAVPPTPGDRNSEFLRELVQAYHCVGQPFLQEGQWERLTITPDAGPRPGSPLSLSASPHTVLYDGLNQKSRCWQGPAILGSAWRQGGSLGVVLVNLTGDEQHGLLSVDAAALGLPASAVPTVLWPEGAGVFAEDGAGIWPVVLGPGRVMIIAFADPVRTWRRQALEDCPWDLLTADEGVLPERVEKDGFLWACSDGPVSQQFRPADASVTAMAVGEQGALVRRVGRQAERRGAAAEGHGLPRRRLEQPFALLRRLPHRITQGLPRVTVLGGDSDWLLCRVAGACELTFPKPGLAVVHGEALSDATAALALRDRVVVPGTPSGCLVAYWVPDRAAGRVLADRARSAGMAVVEADASRQALERFHESPTLSHLAALSRSLAAMLEAAHRMPALAAPGAPLVAVMQRCNALVAAASGVDLALVAEDDWLTPRLPKTVTLVTTGGSAPPDVRLVVLAEAPQPGDVQVIPESADVGSSQVRAQVLLLSERHVERLVPVAAFARSVVAGEGLVQSALLWLESNRPLRLQGPGAVPVALAGRETQAEVQVRNVSPLDLKVAFVVTGPEGWTVAVEPPSLALAGLAEGALRLRLTPPPNAATQSVMLMLKATWVSGESEGILLPVTCSVRERLDVLRQPATAAAVAPTPSRLRHKNQVAFWGQAGDQVVLRFRNHRVSAYQDGVKVRLLDPGFRDLEVRTVAVDETAEVGLSIAETGVFHALIDAGSGSAEVDAGDRPYAEVATAGSPLRLFCSPVQRWFYVTKGASEFRVAARDGGPTETARLRIVDPQGRVAFERDGTWNGEPHAVAVPVGLAGQVWRLECWPVQDLALWLEGGACPYLSTDPGEVPAPLAELAHP